VKSFLEAKGKLIDSCRDAKMQEKKQRKEEKQLKKGQHKHKECHKRSHLSTDQPTESSSSSSDDEKAKKRIKKQERKQEKMLLKEERKQNKKEHKSHKKEHHHGSREKEESLVLAGKDSWPREGNNLYLDGNNMLFVLAPIRKIVLQGRGYQAACSILTEMARQFADKMKLEKCTVVFDTGNHTNVQISDPSSSTMTSPGPSFEVIIARPSFPTSDDALVAYATARATSASEDRLNNNNANSNVGGVVESKVPCGLFVTSDRELIHRLKECSATVCRPKEWFQFAARVLTQGIPDLEGLVNSPNDRLNLDAWAQRWIDSHYAEMEANREGRIHDAMGVLSIKSDAPSTPSNAFQMKE